MHECKCFFGGGSGALAVGDGDDGRDVVSFRATIVVTNVSFNNKDVENAVHTSVVLLFAPFCFVQLDDVAIV